MTKEQYNKLADLVRTAPEEANASILWAVRYHVALFLWGIEPIEQTIDALIKACNTNRDDGIVARFGLEALEKLQGAPLTSLSKWEKSSFIVRSPDEPTAEPSSSNSTSEANDF